VKRQAIQWVEEEDMLVVRDADADVDADGHGSDGGGGGIRRAVPARARWCCGREVVVGGGTELQCAAYILKALGY
jgi:hypothetical protein